MYSTSNQARPISIADAEKNRGWTQEKDLLYNEGGVWKDLNRVEVLETRRGMFAESLIQFRESC